MTDAPHPNPLPTLPLHLTLSMSAWISSTIASACLKHGFQHWKGLSNPLRDALQNLPEAVSAEARESLNEVFEGIQIYQSTPYRRAASEPPVIWRHGNARLLDYGVFTPAKGARPTVLLIPSLINRYYILDLEEGRSFARFLASQGISPLVLDWDVPGEREKGFACADYVEDHLASALKFIWQATNKPVTIAGYCMGGNLAMALATLMPKQTAALALLATPWDFRSKDIRVPQLPEAALAQMERWIGAQETLPAQWIQSLFYLVEPWLFQDKFRRLAKLKPESAAFREFVALEHWVNDGVPITRGVAKDCLIEWGQRNQMAERRWVVGAKHVVPGEIKVPSFVAAPKRDHIVPPGCALPLAELLPDATLCQPHAGHVGMVVGSRARKELWEPFAAWVLRCSAA